MVSQLRHLVIDYINSQFDPKMNWKDAEYAVKKMERCLLLLKGVTSQLHDAKKAIDIGATAIMVSNHGGRQLRCLTCHHLMYLPRYCWMLSEIKLM